MYNNIKNIITGEFPNTREDLHPNTSCSCTHTHTCTRRVSKGRRRREKGTNGAQGNKMRESNVFKTLARHIIHVQVK